MDPSPRAAKLLDRLIITVLKFHALCLIHWFMMYVATSSPGQYINDDKARLPYSKTEEYGLVCLLAVHLSIHHLMESQL